MAEVLAERFQTLDALRAASLAELEAIPEIGPVVAASVHEFFQDPENQALLDDLASRRRRPRSRSSRGQAAGGKLAARRQDVRPDRHAAQAHPPRGRGADQAARRQGDRLGLEDRRATSWPATRPAASSRRPGSSSIPIIDEAEFERMAEGGDVRKMTMGTLRHLRRRDPRTRRSDRAKSRIDEECSSSEDLRPVEGDGSIRPDEHWWSDAAVVSRVRGTGSLRVVDELLRCWGRQDDTRPSCRAVP